MLANFYIAKAQVITDTIKWEAPVAVIDSINSFSHLSFENALFYKTGDIIPKYSNYIKIPLNKEVSEMNFDNRNFVALSDAENKILKTVDFQDKIEIEYYTTSIANENFLVYSFYPIKKSGSSFEKIKEFSISYKLKEKERALKINNYVSNSVLKTGKWLKVAISSDGVYKLSFDELSSNGVVSGEGVKVYGGYHGDMPETFTKIITDDLQELAIYINKGSDGVFSSGDYILFYAQGPNEWVFDGIDKFRHHLNNYSYYNYYFITTGAPKEVQTINSLPESSANHTVTNFTDYKFHEIEGESLIHSGKMFVNERFIPTYNNYNFTFNFPNIDTDEDINVYGSFVARSTEISTFKLKIGSEQETITMSGTSNSSYTFAYKNNNLDWSFKPSSSSLTMSVTYQNNPAAPDSKAWLDYIGIVAKRHLQFYGNSMSFRNTDVIETGSISKFNITNANNGLVLWDINNPYQVNKINYNISGSTISFVAETDTLKNYIIFNGSGAKSPAFINRQNNQDLHGIADVDYIILSHPDFMSYANELADIHRKKDGMTVQVINPALIYNEFSSGKPDITAIRNFLKMMWDRSGGVYPKYLLLFGDGSFDNRTPISSGNSNFILTFQSKKSLSQTSSYVSDDFYGILEDNKNMVSGNLNIGVGRMVVQTQSEAAQMLTKIKKYISPISFGSWRNMITFIGDDEDQSMHTKQADELATMVQNNQPVFNLEKIYFDAFPEFSTPSGERYPDVNKAFKDRMKRGCLILNYTGHGNEYGLAHERILAINDILAWKNINTLPLFFTATCEFTRWDDKRKTTAGEYVFLNPDGGGIGMLTTTRLVYATQNFKLSKAFYSNAFGHKDLRFGDMARITKNLSGENLNRRNFSLIGDPALKLAYPKYTVNATIINGDALPDVDTLKAMSQVEIEGEIVDDNNSLLDFDGMVYPVVYDKFKTITTLGNGDNIPMDFEDQSSILFKGKASVVDGKFKFSFIVPKDIAYNYGNGKISFYAHSQNTDANGYNADLIIGGSSDSLNVDDKGPDIELYLNDEQFITGGLTNETPILLSNLFDESGINTVGNGIGHDIVATIDENTPKAIILNDFYEAETDNFKAGSLNYQLSKLSNGTHSLKLKAWDVFNNSSEAYIDFVVSESANLALDHIFNYPNPFTTNTDFYFDHNMPSANLHVMINIFTVSGKIVKTLEADMNTTGYRSNPINWNGLDDYGDKIGKGVYVYKITVKTDTGEEISEFEKLVILR